MVLLLYIVTYFTSVVGAEHCVWSQGELMDNDGKYYTICNRHQWTGVLFLPLKCMIGANCGVQGQNGTVGTGRHVFKMERSESYLLKKNL